MMCLLLVLTSFLSCSSAIPTTNNGRIVGGHDIAIEEAPYQVSVQYEGQHGCGGSIIAPNYIVTAGHCTDGTREEEMSVRAGTSVRETGGQVIPVKKISPHPKYTGPNGYPDYDVAILELAANFELGFQVAVISLPTENQSWPAGTDAFISGWGMEEFGGTSYTVNLKGATVQLVDQNSCIDIYGGITERMCCAGVEAGGIDACGGDSGGPLQVNGVLAGIVSFGSGCGEPGIPGVYTNVSVVLDFIHDVTGL